MRNTLLLVSTFVSVFGVGCNASLYAQSGGTQWTANHPWLVSTDGNSRFLALTEIGMDDPAGENTPRLMRFLIGCRDNEVGVLALDSADRPVIAFLPNGAIAVDKAHPGSLVGCVNASLRLKIGRDGPSYSVVNGSVPHQISIDPAGVIAAVTSALGIAPRLNQLSETVVVGRCDDGAILRIGLGQSLWRPSVPYVSFDAAGRSGQVATYFQFLEFGGDAGIQYPIPSDSRARLMKAVGSHVDGPNADRTSPLSNTFGWMDADRRYLQASDLLWNAWPFRNPDLASRLQIQISALESDTDSFATEKKAVASINAIRSMIDTAYPRLGWLGPTSFSDRCLYPVVPRSIFRNHLEIYVGKVRLAHLVKSLTLFAANTKNLSQRRDTLALLFRLGLTSPECSKIGQIAQEWSSQDKLVTAAILLVNGDPSWWNKLRSDSDIADIKDATAAHILLETLIFLETEPPASVVASARKGLFNEPDADVRTHVIALVMKSKLGRQQVLETFSKNGMRIPFASDVLTVLSATSSAIRQVADKPLLAAVCDRSRIVCLDVSETPENRTQAALLLRGLAPTSATVISAVSELWSCPDRTSRQLALKLRQSRNVGKWAASDWTMIDSAAAAADSALRREAVLAAMYAVVTSERQESQKNREKAYAILDLSLADADADVRRAGIGVLLIFSKRGFRLPARLLAPLGRSISADKSTENLRLAAYLAHELSPALFSWPPFVDRYPRRPFQWETEWWDEHSSNIRQDLGTAILQESDGCL